MCINVTNLTSLTQNTLKNYQINEGMFLETLDIHAPDWSMATFTDDDDTIEAVSTDASAVTAHPKLDPEAQKLLSSLTELKESIPLHMDPNEIILRLGQVSDILSHLKQAILLGVGWRMIAH